MEQVYNPYMPLTEYVPDGEPHVFGDRVYVYGSHDRAGGTGFCEDNYVVWSAPVSDLRDWRCEGTSYMKNQDPSNPDGSHPLYAPDCVQGPDGRYYLYYCLDGLDEIGVAVSDRPAGPFSFYGHVLLGRAAENAGGAEGQAAEEEKEAQPVTPDGWLRYMENKMTLFDPGVFVEGDRVYLYFGFCRSYVVELLPDMLTPACEPAVLIPNRSQAKGTPYEGHAFFEASSLRKIRGRYYFIYSSELSHELCYATGDCPTGPFAYGGVLISNGDIGMNGRTKPVTQIGNTHGSIEIIGENAYVFYHRQTNATEFSRQACAEKIKILEDGSIPQVEITSCGLNGEGLIASGSYPAAIACHLADRTVQEKIDYSDPAMKERVRVTQECGQVYIAGIRNRTKIGYKYFRFMDADLMAAELRGSFFGTLTIAFDENGRQVIGEYEVQVNNAEWDMQLIPITPSPGTHALYLYFRGQGTLDMKTLAFFST